MTQHDEVVTQPDERTAPPAFTGVSPYLRYPDGDAAADWLIRVLGFGPARSVRDADGHWAEGEVAIGPAGRVDINGGGDPAEKGAGALLIVGVSDVDDQFRRIRASGAPIDPPRDEAYGPRTCHVTDPWATSGTSGKAPPSSVRLG